MRTKKLVGPYAVDSTISYIFQYRCSRSGRGEFGMRPGFDTASRQTRDRLENQSWVPRWRSNPEVKSVYCTDDFSSLHNCPRASTKIPDLYIRFLTHRFGRTTTWDLRDDTSPFPHLSFNKEIRSVSVLPEEHPNWETLRLSRRPLRRRLMAQEKFTANSYQKLWICLWAFVWTQIQKFDNIAPRFGA